MKVFLKTILNKVLLFLAVVAMCVVCFPFDADAVVKTYYIQENGTCGNSYGTTSNLFKPTSENGSNCDSRSSVGGRYNGSNSGRDLLIGYTPVYSSATSITGQSGSNIRFTETNRGPFTGRVRLAEVNAAGNAIIGYLTGEITTTVDSQNRTITDLTSLSGTINAGNRLALVVRISHSGDTEAFTYFGLSAGAPSGEAIFVVDETSLCAATDPSSLTATATSSTSIDLSWPSTAGNDSYSLYRDEVPSVGEVSITTGVTGTSYSDSGLNPGTTYVYRISGWDNIGSCESSPGTSSNNETTPVAQNDLTAGALSFPSAGQFSISVEVAYTGDDDNDATCQIKYGTSSGGPYTFVLTTTKDPIGKVCTATANGLLQETLYYFEATFSDLDGVTGSPVTGQRSTTGNPLLHKSANLGSKYGTWGDTFTCNTCHTSAGTTNIKRIKTSINTPNSGSRAVVFLDTRNGSSDFGDDSDGHSSSNRVCEVCHTQTSYHRLDSSGISVTDHNNNSDCMACHPHRLGFKPLKDCALCHGVGTPSSAPKIVDASGGLFNGQAYGSHLKVTPTDDLSSVSAWEVQCGQCHEMHNGAVFIPNNPDVGIDYSDHGGIYLGGASTNVMINTMTTEAEICWGCHDNNGGSTSEWNAMAGDGFTVTGGSNWTAATFDIVGNAVPDRATLSVHTANDIDVDTGGDVRNSSVANNVNWSGSVGTLRDGVTGQAVPVMENVSAIRCSYCHDVHGTANYTGIIADADDPDGAPYLRGTWLSNPYPIERPPETGDNYPGNVFPSTGGTSFPSGFNVPRLYADSAGSASIGGFFIDQNSGYPTRKEDNSYMTVGEVGGICTLCHGSDVNNMDYYATENLWQGTNGHSNSTVSGSGSNAVDIFDARRGNNTYNMHMQGLPDTQGNDRRWGSSRNGSMPFGGHFNGPRPDRANNNYLPPRNTGWYGGVAGDPERNSLAEYSKWYNGAGGAGAIGSNGDGFTNRAHSFSCSKCHTPHASGLPALLITNCLDPAIGTWSNNQGSTTVGPGAWGGANTRNRFNAMGNCHRNEGTASGWNKLAEGE